MKMSTITHRNRCHLFHHWKPGPPSGL